MDNIINTLKHKRILLGITGGIAAYKSADLVRRLRERGAEVRVVMTRSACEFITPLTLQAVSRKPPWGILNWRAGATWS
jgi:phosphopantothenoylcysteine decarboxylase/phosphopantothenate--cysteine ligase